MPIQVLRLVCAYGDRLPLRRLLAYEKYLQMLGRSEVTPTGRNSVVLHLLGLTFVKITRIKPSKDCPSVPLAVRTGQGFLPLCLPCVGKDM